MKKAFQVIVGLAIALLLLWLLFRDTDWSQVFAAVRSAHWGWLFAAAAMMGIGFFTRVVRWGYVVRSVHPARFGSMFNATQIGFLGNFILPGRAGELIRALVLSRNEKVAFSQSLAFVALDRVLDLAGLLTVTLLTALAFTPEQDIQLPAEFGGENLSPALISGGVYIIAAAIAAVVAAFVLLYVKQDFFVRLARGMSSMLSERLAARVEKLLRHFAEGMHVFRSPWNMACGVVYSLITWGLNTIFFYCALRAFDIAAPWYASLLIITLLSVAVTVPGAPGFVGQYHYAFVGALLMTAPAVDLDTAKAAAIVSHIVTFACVAAAGIVSLYLEGVGLAELRQQGAAAQDELHVKPETTPPQP